MGARTHRYELDNTKGSSMAAAWNARNRQRPAAIIAPIRERGLLENDMKPYRKLYRRTSPEASIALRSRVDARRGGCYKVQFEAAV